jgi:hypothetical protein
MMKKMLGIGLAGLFACGLCLSVACEDDDDGSTVTPPPECAADLAALQMLQPTATDTLHVGTEYLIKWCFPTDISLVQVEFTNDDGENWVMLSAQGGVQKPTNSYPWTPQASHVGTACNVRVAMYGDVSGGNVLSDFFVVMP